MRPIRAALLMFCVPGVVAGAADPDPVPLAPGVRGLVVRATSPIAIDGKLREWAGAFCTPVHHAHKDLENRAAQFFYLWDDEAFAIGLRALDRKPAHPGGMGALYNGDAVEFYFDARPGELLRGKDWSTGAVHLFFTAFEKAEVRPRWAVRQGIATSNVQLRGVEIAGSSEGGVTEVEFKIPWANFPEFVPRAGSVLALDAELCSGDGAARVDRTFAYGSPLSVQQPASLGAVELVGAFDPSYLAAVGPAAFPMVVDVPWTQAERARVRAVVGIPPDRADAEKVGAVEVRIHDVDGRIVRTIPAAVESFGPPGAGFRRAVASWSIDDFAPNTYFATAQILADGGRPMATVAPRLVQEAQMSGR